jgi:hypothetical protein
MALRIVPGICRQHQELELRGRSPEGAAAPSRYGVTSR